MKYDIYFSRGIKTHRKTADGAKIRRNEVTSLDTFIGDILILNTSVTYVTWKFFSWQDFEAFTQVSENNHGQVVESAISWHSGPWTPAFKLIWT